MGQYYKIINVDKKQVMEPLDFENGMKLTEWAWSGNWLVLALLNLLKDEWKGDRVYVVGDYAETKDRKDDSEEIWYKAHDKIYGDILLDHLIHLKKTEGIILFGRDEYMPTIYAMTEHWERIKPGDVECRRSDVRYIYNHQTEQFIDLLHCPIEWIYRGEDNAPRPVRMAPLPLLLAMGNGRGGGDYWEEHNNADIVGSWCDTSASIDCEAEPVEAFSNYTEFAPDFTERDRIVPYTELDAELIAFLQDNKEL